MLLCTEAECMDATQITSDMSLQTAQPFSQCCDTRHAGSPIGISFLLGVCSGQDSPGIACVQLLLYWGIRSPTVWCKVMWADLSSKT